MKKIKLKEKGITLIALVITIVILLILVGVTLNTALSNNGLFKRAKQATEEYGRAEQNEIEILNDLEGKVDDNKVTTEEGKKFKEEKKLAKELHAGDYVYYPAADGKRILCQVLYDKAYNDANKTNYGVQLMACEGVEEVEIKDINNVASMINLLNTKVEELRNGELTNEGYTRHLGTNPLITSKSAGTNIDLNRLNELVLNEKIDETKLENCWYAWGNTTQYISGGLCICGYDAIYRDNYPYYYRLPLTRNRIFIM